MQKTELIEKLKIFLEKHEKFDEECQVTHLFILIRKIIESQDVVDKNKHELIKFYCDWVLHVDKRKIVDSIKDIMNNIDRCIPKDKSKIPFIINNKMPDLRFTYMDNLRKEMKLFFEEININYKALYSDSCWIRVITLLTEFLTNSPIIDPNVNIKSFSFKPANRGAVIWEIVFKDERKIFRGCNVF